jgi:hypothetical protein
MHSGKWENTFALREREAVSLPTCVRENVFSLSLFYIELLLGKETFKWNSLYAAVGEGDRVRVHTYEIKVENC